MSLADFLIRLTGALDEAAVPYMVVGSVASSLHGEPRTTQDLDVVVDLDEARLPALLGRFPDDAYYVSEEAARAAVRRRGQFNIIDFATGWKADLIILKPRPYSQEEFRRRQRARVLGVEIEVATPEDVVLTKLEWAARSGGSERQLRDARGVLSATGQQPDDAYLDRWAATLGVADLLAAARVAGPR